MSFVYSEIIRSGTMGFETHSRTCSYPNYLNYNESTEFLRVGPEVARNILSNCVCLQN